MFENLIQIVKLLFDLVLDGNLVHVAAMRQSESENQGGKPKQMFLTLWIPRQTKCAAPRPCQTPPGRSSSRTVPEVQVLQLPLALPWTLALPSSLSSSSLLHRLLILQPACAHRNGRLRRQTRYLAVQPFPALPGSAFHAAPFRRWLRANPFRELWKKKVSEKHKPKRKR